MRLTNDSCITLNCSSVSNQKKWFCLYRNHLNLPCMSEVEGSSVSPATFRSKFMLSLCSSCSMLYLSRLKILSASKHSNWHSQLVVNSNMCTTSPTNFCGKSIVHIQGQTALLIMFHRMLFFSGGGGGAEDFEPLITKHSNWHSQLVVNSNMCTTSPTDFCEKGQVLLTHKIETLF